MYVVTKLEILPGYFNHYYNNNKKRITLLTPGFFNSLKEFRIFIFTRLVSNYMNYTKTEVSNTTIKDMI